LGNLNNGLQVKKTVKYGNALQEDSWNNLWDIKVRKEEIREKNGSNTNNSGKNWKYVEMVWTRCIQGGQQMA
jgi:hypothetical protein